MSSFASSYVKTTTIAVARNADRLTYPSAGNWTIRSPYTVYGEAKLNGIRADGVWQPLIGSVEGNYTALTLTKGAASQDPQYSNNTDGTGASITYSDANKQTLTKYVGKYDGVNVQIAVAGNLGTQTVVGTMPSEQSNLIVGGQGAASNEFFGTIRNVRIYSRALSDAQLQAMTT